MVLIENKEILCWFSTIYAVNLTSYTPVLYFYTPWKHQKTFRYRKATPGCKKYMFDNHEFKINCKLYPNCSIFSINIM